MKSSKFKVGDMVVWGTLPPKQVTKVYWSIPAEGVRGIPVWRIHAGGVSAPENQFKLAQQAAAQ